MDDKMIWKFHIPDPSSQIVSIEMPIGAEILTVQMQGDEPCLWAVIDPSHGKETRTFRWAGTGHLLGTVGSYIGTIQMLGGGLIWHFFLMDR